MRDDLVVLAVDCSTTGAKASVWSLTGTEVASGRANLDLSIPAPGRGEQDPRQWWSAMQAAVRSAVQGLDVRRVAAVTVTHQRGNMDISVAVKGDLHIDEHHTIEDVAITLGETFLKALDNKKGIERYGFLLPMDDCLAQVAIDFSGRPWLVWDAVFTREKIGEMPTEMFMHFFKSFSDNAKCNLNIKAEGDNEHHKIESIFKAFAKAIKMAVSKTDNYSIPSTKGSL